MIQTIDDTLKNNTIKDTNIKHGKYEFIGPDFTNNGYSNAHYRISKNTIHLEDIDVPSHLEVLNKNGEWQQHPVVFMHYGTYETLKYNTGTLIIFLKEGKYTSSSFDALAGRRYERAKKLGLTLGNQSEIKSIPKDNW